MTTGLDALLAVDPALLSHDERLDHLAAMEAAKSALDARAQVTLHLLAIEDEYDGLRRELEREWVREEVAGVLRLAPVTAGHRLHDATTLVTRLPATLAMVAAGSITMLHAWALVEATDKPPSPSIPAPMKRNGCSWRSTPTPAGCPMNARPIRSAPTYSPTSPPSPCIMRR